jgi:hypothetical protein
VEVDVPPEPPAPGTGRVILDTNGERAHVVELVDDGAPGVRSVCPATPCVVDLPYGPHPLVFQSTTDGSRQSEAAVDIGPRPKVLRHTLGERNDGGTLNTLGASFLVLGTLVATTGAILWLAGASDANASLAPSGQVITGIGVGSMILSIPLLVAGRPTERPGATTEWTLPATDARDACGPPRSVPDRL